MLGRSAPLLCRELQHHVHGHLQLLATRLHGQRVKLALELDQLAAELLIVMAHQGVGRLGDPPLHNLLELLEIAVHEESGYLRRHRVSHDVCGYARPGTERKRRRHFDLSARPGHTVRVIVSSSRYLQLVALSACLVLPACKRPGSSSGQQPGDPVRASSTAVVSAASEESSDPPTSRAPKKNAGAGQKISIPAGTLLAGSMPGDRGRDATLEPPLVKIELGAFEIDRLAYPNDPGQPPRTDVTRSQAQELCAQRGQRLCTELEWERACKGPDNDVFATGAGWDPACDKNPAACASAFDVIGMGAGLREWTSSTVEPADKEERAFGALRGGRAGAAETEHRCARREPADPGAHGTDIGFRCCSGTASTATISRPKPLQTFRRVQLDIDQVNAMLQTIPQLKTMGKVTLFKDPDDVNLVIAKGDAGIKGNIVTTNPLMWSPDLGEELLVITGKGASGSSFVAAFHHLSDDRYRVASAFVLEGESAPIVLAFNGYVKNRITWSTCWGCLGEEGAVVYRPDRRVVIEQF